MAKLKDFALYPIAWNLTPEDAVTLYLEWGNNDWNAEYPPVRSKSDVAIYFVVDSWEKSARFAACAPQFRKRGGSVFHAAGRRLAGRLAQGQRGLAGSGRAHAQK